MGKKECSREKPINVQAFATMKRFRQIQISNAPKPDPIGHLPRRMDFLVAHVHNLGQSMPTKFVNSMDSVLPKMVVDVVGGRAPQANCQTLYVVDLLSQTSVALYCEGEKSAQADPSTTEPHMTDDAHPDTLVKEISEPTQGEPKSSVSHTKNIAV
nr:hypothetical protein [Tanacetum cinerariifolium]